MIKQRSPKNLLVTGGAGFIGSAFIRYLLKEVTSFSGTLVNLDCLTYAGNLNNLKNVEKDPRYNFEQGNILDKFKVESLCNHYKIDTIIHFAAESHVDTSILNPQLFIETNILGTFNLLEVVRKYPHIHFHHVSTDEVYGSLGDTGAFTEETPYCPNSPYSASKASSDHFVRAYEKTYQISFCLSNCSNNFGPYQFPEKLIPVIILNCLKKKPIPVYGKGLNIRDWLFVNDHVKALWLLLEYGKKGETYNIGGDQEWKNIDLVKAIIRVVARMNQSSIKELEQLITFITDRPGHDFRYAIDCSKINKELLWKQEHTFTEAIEETVHWYKNHYLPL